MHTDLREFYENEVYKNKTPQNVARHWVISIVTNMEKFDLSNKSVLDVGAGFGLTLNRLKIKGIIPFAVELSDLCIDYLRGLRNNRQEGRYFN